MKIFLKKLYKNKLIIGILLILISLYIVIYNTNTFELFEPFESSDINKEHIDNPNNAYVINLEKDADRLTQLQKKFENSRIHLVRVPAIVNKQNGHIGCGMSFVKTIQFAKDNNLNTVLIFEDDNKPLKGFEKRWIIIKEWLDSNLDKWDVYNGGARFIDWLSYNSQSTSEWAEKTKLAYSINENEHLFTCPITCAGNWIYVNSKAYDKLIEWKNIYNKNGFVPFDQYFTNTDMFDSVFSIPHLALQENGVSNTSFTNGGNYFQFDKVDTQLIKIFNDVYNKEIL